MPDVIFLKRCFAVLGFDVEPPPPKKKKKKKHTKKQNKNIICRL